MASYEDFLLAMQNKNKTDLNIFADITTEGLLRAMPFENYVQMYDLKGKYLLEALEFSVGGNVGSTPGEFNSGRMLQIGGKFQKNCTDQHLYVPL